MAKPTIASLEERIAALEAAFAALKAQPRRTGRWQPSAQQQNARAEYLRRTAAGERVVVRGGKCVAVD